jgi:5-bromo-4-chloroindolyl phosphate hydrolysis protein
MDAVMPSGFRRETMLKIGLSIILNFLLVAVVTFMAASSSFGLTENSTVIGLLGITLIFSVIWSVSKYARRSFG